MLTNQNFVTQSLSVQQQNPEFNIATVGIVSLNTANFNGASYIQTNSALEVESIFGTNSNEYIAVKRALNQSKYKIQNIAKYSFVFIPVSLTSAKKASVLTTSLTYANFKALTNGEFAIAINGASAVNIIGLNFTKTKTLEDVAKIINDLPALEDVDVSLQGDKILFESIMIGVNSSITISAVSGGTGTSLIGSNYLNIAGATLVNGADASDFSTALINQLKIVYPLTRFSFFTIASLIDITNIKAIHSKLKAESDLKDNICFVYNITDSSEAIEIKNNIYTINGSLQPRQIINFYSDLVNIKENDNTNKEFISFNVVMACAFVSNDITKQSSPVLSNHSKSFDGFTLDPNKLIQSEHNTAVANYIGTFGVYPFFGYQFFNAIGRYNGFQIATILNLQGSIANALRVLQNNGNQPILAQNANTTIKPPLNVILNIAKDNFCFDKLKSTTDISSYTKYASINEFISEMSRVGFYVYVDSVNIANNTVNVYIYFIISEEIYVINQNINIIIN
jgi:hypothetical protein